MSKRKRRLPFLYLIARGPRPDYHRAPYHPVIICDNKRAALWEAGDTSAKAWVWSSENDPVYNWLLERWQGLDIDYGFVIHHVDLPDGTPTAYYDYKNSDDRLKHLFQGAVWWSDREMPAWLQERGVVYPPDRFTRQKILDFIANDGHSGFNDRPDPPYWPPAVSDEVYFGEPESGPVYRVRRERCLAPGSSIVVYHADIPAESPEEALEIARGGKALWRWIDRYDSGKEKFVTYECLGLVSEPKDSNPNGGNCGNQSL